MSEKVIKIDREAAKLDPESQFAGPEAVAAEEGLTRGEKISALKRWAELVQRRLEAGNEGMPTNDTDTRDAALLQSIEETILDLQNAEPKSGR